MCRRGKDEERSMRKNKSSGYLTLREAASPVWGLPCAFRIIQTTEGCVSSLVTQAQQGWCQTLPSSGINLLCSFYSPGFHQEASWRHGSSARRFPSPAAVAHQALYIQTCGQRSCASLVSAISLLSSPAWPEVDSIFPVSLQME